MLERNDSEPDHATTFMYGNSIITFKINIIVIDINGQRSNSSVVERSISDMPNIRSSKLIAIIICITITIYNVCIDQPYTVHYIHII